MRRRAQLVRCASCAMATDARRPRCVLCGAPWRLSRRRRLYVELVTGTLPAWLVVLVALAQLGGTA